MAGGRPLKYNKEDFESVTAHYLEDCIGLKEIPNKAGLLGKLRISRDTWADYKKREEFSDTIRQAEAAIENAWVQRLSSSGATGAIFYLKNAFKETYRDSHDVTSDGKVLPTPILAATPHVPTNNSNAEDTGTDEED